MRPKALFGTVVVAGVGLIGGSVGLGTRQRFLAERVVGFDHDPAALEAARGMGVIDEAHLHPGAWLREAELVVLASPARTLVASARQLVVAGHRLLEVLLAKVLLLRGHKPRVLERQRRRGLWRLIACRAREVRRRCRCRRGRR